jgi:hypothetical protein
MDSASKSDNSGQSFGDGGKAPARLREVHERERSV